MVCPLAVINDSRRKDVAIDVGHLIGADDEGVIPLAELIDKGLHRMWRRVGVVGVELDGIATAARVVDGFVPVAANGMVGLVLGNIDKFASRAA